MSSAQKIIQAAAGNAAGEALYVEDVFSTYLYDGTGSAQTITNDIDLDGEGGMVWTKRRDSTTGAGPWINDTERGITKYLGTYATSAETDNTGGLSAVSSTGYTLGTFAGWNASGGEYASWTFRKAPKFFDVVTYTGDGTASQTISHNLGSTPGVVILKKTNGSGSWFVWHRGLSSYRSVLYLSTTSQELTNYDEMAAYPDASNIYVGGNVSFNNSNNSGGSYVAYLFAHNDSDGDFGEDADQDIIKCGSYAGSASDVFVNLGFEPQFVITKNISSASNWLMMDTMRGMPHGDGSTLAVDSSAAEDGVFGGDNLINPTANGFIAKSGKTASNTNGDNHIYIAIRRGPMKTPTSGTEVFAIDTLDGSTEPAWDASFDVVDMALRKYNNSNSDWLVTSRLTQGKKLKTNSSSTETSDVDEMFDYMDGWSAENGTSANFYSWMFRRAPGFFDVVAYAGTGASLTLDHNLGVAPELVIMRRRDATANWAVSLPGHTQYAYLNLSNAAGSGSLVTSTSSTQMTIIGDSDFNSSGSDAIAYLFATLPGISKVGSYTGNASTSAGTQTIDCGFSNGARFVLIKCTSGTGNWTLFDSERGITSGLDNFLLLNATDAQTTNGDIDIDSTSSGFIINSDHTSTNRLGREYIFYAIA